MARMGGLTTDEIQAIFQEEMTTAGGTVTGSFNDGARLFTRSLLPRVREVRRSDEVQGGVALRATEREVCVHPYVFRIVCSNGAIMAHATQTERIADLDRLTREEVTSRLHAAIRACCAEEAFTVAAEQMRSASAMAADHIITVLHMFSGRASQADRGVMKEIVKRYLDGQERSRFALMNAVTSVARDTEDPELRWRLEEAGGGIPVGLRPVPFLPDEAATHRLPWRPDLRERVPADGDPEPRDAARRSPQYGELAMSASR
jgi:hypothetical protein